MKLIDRYMEYLCRMDGYIATKTIGITVMLIALGAVGLCAALSLPAFVLHIMMIAVLGFTLYLCWQYHIRSERQDVAEQEQDVAEENEEEKPDRKGVLYVVLMAVVVACISIASAIRSLEVSGLMPDSGVTGLIKIGLCATILILILGVSAARLRQASKEEDSDEREHP